MKDEEVPKKFRILGEGEWSQDDPAVRENEDPTEEPKVKNVKSSILQGIEIVFYLSALGAGYLIFQKGEHDLEAASTFKLVIYLSPALFLLILGGVVSFYRRLLSCKDNKQALKETLVYFLEAVGVALVVNLIS